MSLFENQTILITGATGGIGSTTSFELASQGARLILLARNEDALSQLADHLPGGPHKTIVSDIQDDDSLQSAIAEISKAEPDIIIHALGGTLGFRNQDPTHEQWQLVFNLNFHAIVQLNQSLLHKMKARGSGRIIHLCSSSADNCRGAIAYGSAKAALANYTRSIGKRIAKSGVTVFGYCPGIVESPNNWAKAKTENPEAYNKACQSQPLGRLQTTEEVAKNLAFFCKPEANIYAGCIINADGSL